MKTTKYYFTIIICFFFVGCVPYVSLQGEVSDGQHPLEGAKIIVYHSNDNAPFVSYFGFQVISDSLGKFQEDFKAAGSKGVAVIEKEGFISDTSYFNYHDGDTIKVKFSLKKVYK